ncbi:MAG: transposase family protein [Actinobacteria bacterium]|nr:MAG: transposase family protein [Actinomycetota bacterium]
MEHRRGAALRLWSQRGGLRQGESRGRGTIPSGRSQHHRRCPIHRGPRLASTHHRSPPGIHESQHPAAGAHTIAFHLTERRGSSPAVSTIWRVLTRRGFVAPQPQKRPKSSFVRFEAFQPNERWQADLTHWSLAGGADVEILNIVDDHSRLLVASEARPTTKAADVVASFHRGFAAHGFPASVLTDNAAVFTAAPRGGGRCAIEIELDALGIALRHSSPYHPQTCGKVERFHQTLKKWLAKQPRTRSLEELQGQLDWFCDYYNTIRPHRALGRRTPARAFAARPPAAPALPGLVVPAHYRVRRDRIDSSGKLTLRYNSRLHHIGLGRRHAGVRVLVLVADLDVRILTQEGELLRQLMLDPARDYQPQGS